jgi:membrane protein
VSHDQRQPSERSRQLRRRVEELAQAPRVRPFVPTAERLARLELIDRGAALTYYGLLGVIPALIVVLSVIGLFGSEHTIDEALDIIADHIPAGDDSRARTKFADLLQQEASSSALLGLGIVGVLWTASAFVGSFFRASATIWEVRRRPFWRAWPQRMGLTVLLLMVAAISLSAVVVTGQLARSIGEAIGLTDATVTLYEILKWPAILILLVVLVGVLYRASPSGERTLTWLWLLTPGGAFAVLAWLVVSGGFTVYVQLFGSYETTYGALGTTIVTMAWMWLMNLVLLAGAVVDAELERWKRSDGA